MTRKQKKPVWKTAHESVCFCINIHIFSHDIDFSGVRCYDCRNSQPQSAGKEHAAMHQDLRRGLRDGLPIALGYFPVSFTFGILAVSGGLSFWQATLISLMNLTSAGQFAE